MSAPCKIAPHVAAVHDLSGMGRCSLGVVLPALSAMGCWVSALPTAYLSGCTIYPPSEYFVIRDLTEEMELSGAHWAELGVNFEAIYSGFVGSEAQFEVILNFIRRFRREGTLVLVDPVMGDWGKPYRTYTPAMCEKMKDLTLLADVITPNLTEAAILLGEDYEKAPKGEERLKDWLERLSLERKRSVVITGVHLKPGLVGAACLDRESGEFSFPCAHEEPAQFPGTGDLFASVTLGGLLRGESLEKAAARAVAFVAKCARFTLDLGTPIADGVQLESLLGDLIPR